MGSSWNSPVANQLTGTHMGGCELCGTTTEFHEIHIIDTGFSVQSCSCAFNESEQKWKKYVEKIHIARKTLVPPHTPHSHIDTQSIHGNNLQAVKYFHIPILRQYRYW